MNGPVAAQDIVARHASAATTLASERFMVTSSASDAIKRLRGRDTKYFTPRQDTAWPCVGAEIVSSRIRALSSRRAAASWLVRAPAFAGFDRRSALVQSEAIPDGRLRRARLLEPVDRSVRARLRREGAPQRTNYRPTKGRARWAEGRWDIPIRVAEHMIA